MKPNPPSESELILAVVRRYFPPRRWAVCDNVAWGMLPYEADAIAASPGGVIHELEAKSSKSDLMADGKKRKWGLPPFTDYFSYVVPAALEATAVGIAEPRGFGVYSVDDKGYCSRVTAARRRHVDCTTEKQRDRRNRIWRLCSLRYWDRKMRDVAERER